LGQKCNVKEEDRNTVSIMTMHSAKGLEFNYVYIVGMEEQLFPSHMSLDSPDAMEEERRLFYVALTRARKKASLSYALSRFKWGLSTDCEPSRFLKEINEAFIEWPDDPRHAENAMITFGSKPGGHTTVGNSSGNARTLAFNAKGKNNGEVSNKKSAVTNPNFKPDDPEKIQVGMMIEHQRFGVGKVIHMEGQLPNKKATVFFQQIKQEKQLLLKFAKLRIV
jgi:DNA helicase-2/ATP-dependent DNA helicase PcrA